MKAPCFEKIGKRRLQGPEKIYCPSCKKSVVVQHFQWSAMTCQHCKSDVEKAEWITVRMV